MTAQPPSLCCLSPTLQMPSCSQAYAPPWPPPRLPYRSAAPAAATETSSQTKGSAPSPGRVGGKRQQHEQGALQKGAPRHAAKWHAPPCCARGHSRSTGACTMLKPCKQRLLGNPLGHNPRRPLYCKHVHTLPPSLLPPLLLLLPPPDLVMLPLLLLLPLTLLLLALLPRFSCTRRCYRNSCCYHGCRCRCCLSLNSKPLLLYSATATAATTPMTAAADTPDDCSCCCHQCCPHNLLVLLLPLKVLLLLMPPLLLSLMMPPPTAATSAAAAALFQAPAVTHQVQSVARCPEAVLPPRMVVLPRFLLITPQET